MSSMTAQIAVGHPDMYHGGIRPTHVVWLSENDRPGWILEETWRDLYGGQMGSPRMRIRPSRQRTRSAGYPVDLSTSLKTGSF